MKNKTAKITMIKRTAGLILVPDEVADDTAGGVGSLL